METAAAYFVATVVVVLLLVAAAYAWYNNPSAWESISAKGGDTVAFSAGGRPLNRLRFKDCVFTTQSPSGEVKSWEVTAVLNGMAAAYDVPAPGKTALTLGGSSAVALNPFSFTKSGFNDGATVPTQADSAEWAGVPDNMTTLVGKMRVI